MSKVVSVRLIPKASSERLAVENEMFIIHVTACPERNKANDAMLCLLSTHLKIPKSHLIILRGHTSHNKLVKIL